MSYLLTYNGQAVQLFQDEHKHTSPIKRQVWRWKNHWGYVYPGVTWDHAWVAETRNEVASLWNEKEKALLETVEDSAIQAPPFEVDDLWMEEILSDQQIQCGSSLYIRGTLSEIIDTAKCLGIPIKWLTEVKPQLPGPVCPQGGLVQQQPRVQPQPQVQLRGQTRQQEQPQGQQRAQPQGQQRAQPQGQQRAQEQQAQLQQQPYRTTQQTNGQVQTTESSQRPSSQPLRPSSQPHPESRPQQHREQQQRPERLNQQRSGLQASRPPPHNAQRPRGLRPAPAPEPYLLID